MPIPSTEISPYQGSNPSFTSARIHKTATACGYGASTTASTHLPGTTATMLAHKILRFVPYQSYELPLYSCAVSAGFPSPADDHIDQQIDLNTYIVENPAATFFVRVSGDSMEPAGIFDGDILVVDRSLKFKNNRIVVAAVNGELTVKRIFQNFQSWIS